MPGHHEVKAKNVNLKRLGSILALAHETDLQQFEDLLLLQGLGPRTIQSLSLVSEVIHGTPSRFSDPARFSYAHGGKDGHPFPVPTKVYDESINVLKTSLQKAKLGESDKLFGLKKLSQLSVNLEKNFKADPAKLEKIIEEERQDAHKYGGRTVFGKAKPPDKSSRQLNLFD